MARFRVGLTGGIASGKSAADAAFAGLGVAVVDADVIARELVELGQPALAEIVQAASPHCVAFTLDDSDDLITAADVATTQGRLLPAWLAASVAATADGRGIPAAARVELREARLDAIQLVYGVAALTGQPPAKAIEHELGMTPRTAVHWIRQARTAGRLEGLGYAAARPPHA